MSDGDIAAHEGPKIGRTLELARKERGLSLKQVEETTKIRAGYLEALERENFDVLPAVYVQGSLKTYANFLQLDGEALVRELKRRQAPQQEPAYVEFKKGALFPDHPTVPLVVGSQEATEDEEDSGSTLIPPGVNHNLYLGVGAFLIVVAVALALILTGDRPPAVSQVREPLISQAPPEATPATSKEDKRAHQPNKRGADDKPQPERIAKPPDVNTEDAAADLTVQTWQNTSLPAQGSRELAATQSASPSAETASATAEPETTEPVINEPQTAETATAEPETASTPPAAEEPAQGNAASAPANEPATQSSQAPPPNARGENTPSGGARRNHSGSRNGDDFDVRINKAGSDDPVQIIGNPAN
jgi:cytoskeleton protein RodZ